jgi:hypothetical protein
MVESKRLLDNGVDTRIHYGSDLSKAAEPLTRHQRFTSLRLPALEPRGRRVAKLTAQQLECGAFASTV